MASEDHRRRWTAVRRVAGRQRMLITTRQLTSLGVNEAGRRNAVGQGDLVRRHRGLYALPGAGDSWEDMVLGGVLSAGDGAVASFDTARRLWLPDPTRDRAGGLVETTSARETRWPGVTSHRQVLPPSEVTTRASIPVTTVSRTLLDLAGRLDADGLGELVDAALRARVVSLQELRRVAAASPTAAARVRSGASALTAVVDLRRSGGGPGANGWEERMDREWDRSGLPLAARQHWIETPHGRYCVDRAIVELKIAVEWNGYEYHGQRRRFDRDSDRRGHLVEAGWLVLDFTSQSSWDHIRRTVLAAVAERRRQLGRTG